MFSSNTYDTIESPIAVVAEDNDGIRKRIADYLRGKGYGVLEAKTSVEALLMAADYPFRIDALFTSLELRKYCNGAELAGCLRATRPEMAIFYMGGEGPQSESVTRELIRGEAVLLKKPVEKPRLDEAIAMVEEERARTEYSMDSVEWT